MLLLLEMLMVLDEVVLVVNVLDGCSRRHWRQTAAQHGRLVMTDDGVVQVLLLMVIRHTDEPLTFRRIFARAVQIASVGRLHLIAFSKRKKVFL